MAEQGGDLVVMAIDFSDKAEHAFDCKYNHYTEITFNIYASFSRFSKTGGMFLVGFWTKSLPKTYHLSYYLFMHIFRNNAIFLFSHIGNIYIGHLDRFHCHDVADVWCLKPAKSSTVLCINLQL